MTEIENPPDIPIKETIIYIDNYKIIEYKTTNIYIIENIFEISFCQEMMKLIDDLPLKKTAYTKGNNVECFALELCDLLHTSSSINDELYYPFSINKTTYETLLHNISLSSSHTNLYRTRINKYTTSQIRTYNNRINEKMQIVEKIMKQINEKIAFNYNCGYTLRKHYGATRKHCDGLSNLIKYSHINPIHTNITRFEYGHMARNTTCIFSLNDDFEGGKFSFPDNNILFSLKPGSILIFPPFWTHPHEVSTVTKPRYTICTWTCEPIE